jgi:hypothetical protein
MVTTSGSNMFSILIFRLRAGRYLSKRIYGDSISIAPPPLHYSLGPKRKSGNIAALVQ